LRRRGRVLTVQNVMCTIVLLVKGLITCVPLANLGEFSRVVFGTFRGDSIALKTRRHGNAMWLDSILALKWEDD
jgi:hypothetical protein